MGGKILVVGSLNMDLVINVTRLPQIGETIIGGKFNTFPGGKGANQAVAAARMGASVTMIGRIGRDGFGAELLKSAMKDGIDVRNILEDEKQATGVALITVNAQGQNTIVVASGANNFLAPEDLHQAEQAFKGADLLVIQLESPLETVREAINMAKQHQLQVVLNPAPAQHLDADLLKNVDYFIPNEGEALLVAGESSLKKAIEVLLKLDVRNLIITLGEKGVLLVDRAGQKYIPAYQVKAIDTVAAGDTFVGAFSCGISTGLSVEESARLGNAAAAISVTRQGAQPSMPMREEVDQFLGGKG